MGKSTTQVGPKSQAISARPIPAVVVAPDPQTNPVPLTDEPEHGQLSPIWFVGGSVALVLFAITGMLALMALTMKPSEPEIVQIVSREPDPTLGSDEPNRTREQQPVAHETPSERQPAADISPITPIPTNQPPEPDPPKIIAQGGGRLPTYDEIEFMYVKAQGKRFCIIADVSGSMGSPLAVMQRGKRKGPSTNGHRRIDYLREELLKTINTLKSESEFIVYLFDSKVEAMPGGKWLTGKDREQVFPWIHKIRQKGGTNPAPAFQQAFQLTPRPDVIFFMTDGSIPSKTSQLVAQMNNKEPKVVIHTIQLGTRSILTTRPRPLKSEALKKNRDKLQSRLKQYAKIYKDSAPPQTIQKIITSMKAELEKTEAAYQMELAREKQQAAISQPKSRPDVQLESIARDSGGTYRQVQESDPDDTSPAP